MPLSHFDIVTLIREGRYAAGFSAVALLSKTGRDPFTKVLLAELLERTGRVGQASALAAELLISEVPGSIQARAELVVGDCARDGGDYDRALRAYDRAAAFARSCDDPEQLCWSRLKRLLTAADLSSSEVLVELLRDVRADLVRCGGIAHFIALHVFLAQIESQRGALDPAGRHLNAARSLLKSAPNEWLRGSIAVAELCVAFLTGDFDGALRKAGEVERSVAISGHVATELALLSNLGHVYLAKNDLRSAEAAFSRAASLSGEFVRIKASVMDGLARAKVAAGDYDGAAAVLAELDRELDVGHDTARRFFEYRSTYYTRALMLLRQERFAALVSFVDGILDRPDAVDPSLATDLLLLKAEGQARARNAAASIRTLAAVVVSSATGQAVYTRIKDIAALLAPLAPAADRREDARADAFEKVVESFTHADGPRRLFDALALSCGTLGCELREMNGGAGGTTIARHKGGIARTPDAVHIDLDAAPGRFRIFAEWPSTLAEFKAIWFTRELARALAACTAAARLESTSAPLWPDHAMDEATVARGSFGESAAMTSLRANARRVAASSITVLITGETGVGKDVLARFIHQHSPRAARPFVPFNCSAVPRDMLDAQLFGHRKGAFTGAHDTFPGVIRAASGGTLFLDEIGEVGLDVQPKLLRFLEAGEIHPIGEAQPVAVDVRVIAATNADLDALVRDGRFREDLFYRLNVVRFNVPPLRERREEIPLLVQHFLIRSCHELQKDAVRVAEETMEYLVLYGWPGNVRQLANEIRRMVALAEPRAILMPEHLSVEIAASRRTIPASARALSGAEVLVRLDQPLSAATAHLERTILHYALRQTGGHLESAARLLGLSRKGLYLKRHRLGFEDRETVEAEDAIVETL